MILTIDIGNTQTLFALYDGEVLEGQWRLATDSRRSADEFSIWLEQFLARIEKKPSDCKHVVISCVVPQSVYAITQAIQSLCGLEALLIDNQVMQKIGQKIDTDKPDEVGADRMINALAAWHHCEQAAIVVDFGTATTFDVVSADGAYCGGVIAPGINLSLEALHRAAAKLPNIAITKPEKIIGRTTVDAMQAGIYYGYLGLVEKVIAEIKQEMQQTPRVIATGGLGGLFHAATDEIEILIPDLTMVGLRLTAEKYWGKE